VLTAPCPNCGAELRFRSADLVAKVCDYCRSTVLRRADGLEAVGRAAEVPDDVSPLQLGVTGRDGERRFELIGRVRWRYDEGGWSEWLALYDDGRTGWLGEASGRFMLLRELEGAGDKTAVGRALAAGRPVNVGDEAVLEGVAYRVNDVRAVTCAGSEGELPFPARTGLKAVSVDLMAEDGGAASIQQEDGGPVQVYLGRYVSLADIRASGLRAFDGWPMPRWAA
jgi:hypothetical protein